MWDDLSFIVTGVKKVLVIVGTTNCTQINMQASCTGAQCVQRHFLRNEVGTTTSQFTLVFIGSLVKCVVKDLIKRAVMINTVPSIDDF